MKKTSKNTKSKIVTAAWKLFYEQGYDDTTVEEIIAESGTSKGSFYHYFEGNDALIFLNRELFGMIEDSISISLLSRLLSTQLITKGEKHLLDRSRVYYKLLKQIVSDGQKKGEIRNDMAANEIVKMYAICERSLMYDWCLCNGEYSLSHYADRLMPMFLSEIRL